VKYYFQNVFATHRMYFDCVTFAASLFEESLSSDEIFSTLLLFIRIFLLKLTIELENVVWTLTPQQVVNNAESTNKECKIAKVERKKLN
jgi:hypothetical protein